MKNVKVLSLLVTLGVAGILLTGCNDSEKIEQIGMANPASVYCEENGGTLIPMEDEEGNQYALCQLENGEICEEWAYYRGECEAVDTETDDVSDSTEENSDNDNYFLQDLYAEDTENGEYNNEEPTMNAKILISEDQTPEEIENQINEICEGFGGTWEEGSCVLDDGSTIQF